MVSCTKMLVYLFTYSISECFEGVQEALVDFGVHGVVEFGQGRKRLSNFNHSLSKVGVIGQLCTFLGH